MPALDCLRGVAILAVVVYHAFDGIAASYGTALPRWQYRLFHAAEGGYLGVHLFFVLSGFLISGILLDTRNNRDYYRKFYLRRALRILPAFLLTCLVLVICRAIPWTFLFASIFFLANFALHHATSAYYTGFWSLSVEEQFYLFWPTLLRAVQRRQVFAVAATLVVLTPVLRFILAHFGPPLGDIRYKPWAVLDFFAIGAVSAVLVRSARARLRLRTIAAGLLAFSAFLFASRFLLNRAGWLSPAVLDATDLCPWVFLFGSAVLFAFLTPRAAATIPGRALAFLGFISYGLYLCHALFLHVAQTHWDLGPVVDAYFWRHLSYRILFMTVVSILVAWLSRSTFEQYFLKLKPRQRETLTNTPVAP